MEAELSIENIENLINERKSIYRNADEVVSSYNRENELSNEYNGRQVLELIQNADDAGANTICISLDTTNRVLSVYNDGGDFTYNGMKSIMIANLSSKTSSYYIGNKGLGFRSILKWADRVCIKTGNYEFKFSRDIAKEIANKLNLDLQKIQRERGLREGVCPFPMLAIPKISENAGIKTKGCTIEIHYNDVCKENIYSQINKIDENSLLFLKNVNCVKTKIDNCENELSVEKTNNCVTSNRNNKKWILVKEEDVLPDNYQDPNKAEQKKYFITLAIPQGQHDQDSYPLYNYLPTCEQIALPYIIHATLELDSSRNHVNESDVNQFILGKTAELISRHVDGILKEGPCNWDAYKMMTPINESSSSIIKTHLFDKLKAFRDDKGIFPTICNKYTNKDGYYYYDNNDSSFWQEFKKTAGEIENILFPVPDEIRIERKEIGKERLCDSLHSLNDLNLSIGERASLINYLVRTSRLDNSKGLCLLINEKEDIIDANSSVFTPKTEGVDYALPKHVKIQFLHKELYLQVMELLNQDDYFNRFKNENESSASRCFCRILRAKGIAEISDYDKDQVLRVIVSQTNDLIKESQEPEASKGAICEMVKCLYNIGFETTLESVQLLDDNNIIRKANELMLNSQLNHDIFGDGLHYLLDKSKWGLDCDEEVYNKFFKKLGVNQIIKNDSITNEDLQKYAEWLQDGKVFDGKEPYNSYRMCNAMNDSKFNQFSGSVLSIISQIPLCQIIRLLSNNEDLYEKLLLREELKFKYNRQYNLDTEYTYLRYQLLNLPNIKNKILSDEVILDQGLAVENISAEKYITVIRFLTTNMRETSNEEVADILNELEKKNYPIKSIRKVYKLIIDGLAKDNRSLRDSKNIRLYATDVKGESGYFPVSEVYYTDNNTIPMQIIASVGKKKLYYGARAGAEKVCNVLGIEPFENIEICIGSKEIHEMQSEFSKHYEEMKPYILLYCMQDINRTDDKKTLANRIRNSQITLVRQCCYNMQGKSYGLGANEFLVDDAEYILNAEGYSSMADMYDSVAFCNAITEIISMICKIVSKNDTFVRIFQNLNFMKQSVKVDFPEEEITEVYSLLGMSSEEYSFYRNLLGNRCPERSETKKIYQVVCEHLGIEQFPFEKVDFGKWCTIEAVNLLRIANKKNPSILEHVDLSFLHKKNIDDIKRNVKERFVHSLWIVLKDNKKLQKKYIGIQQDYENLYIELNAHKLYTDDQYEDELKKKIKEAWKDMELTENAGKHPCLYTYNDTELSNEQRSLFYFEGNEEEIRKYVDEIQNETALPHAEINNAASSAVKLTLNAKIVKQSIMQHNNSSTHRSSWVYSEKNNGKKKALGKEAELLVKEVFEKNGYEYKWRSGFSDVADKDDTLGYDFEYKEEGSSEWRFLEVKNFSSGQFIVSAHEYAIAKDSEHKSRYDVALVCDNNVYIVKNFFEGDNYNKTPKDYIISCKIEQN